jgi:hypothetical protein
METSILFVMSHVSPMKRDFDGALLTKRQPIKRIGH